MNFADLQPISNHPALFIKKEKILVIADLHIGIEKQLQEFGLNTISHTNKLKENIIYLIKKYNSKKIFLLGDIKHNIPNITFQEKKDVSDFLEDLISFCEVNIIPGNHDGNIKKIAPNDVIIHSSKGYIYKKIGLIHGHTIPTKELMLSDYLILAHTHPSIMLEDRLGYRYFESCWLKGEINNINLYKRSNSIKFIVLPAFNPFCGGIAINIEGFIGPFNKIIETNECEVFLLDGSYLGKIKDLK